MDLEALQPSEKHYAFFTIATVGFFILNTAVVVSLIMIFAK